MGKAKIGGRKGGKEGFRAFMDGVLLHVEFRAWGATAKLGRQQLLDVVKNEDDADLLRAVRDLYTEEGMTIIKAFNTLRNELKGYVYRNSLPFPVESLAFIPKGKVEDIDRAMQRYKEDFWQLVDIAVDKAEDFKAQAKKAYPRLYDEAKYPTEAQLRNKFAFRWTFRTFSPPDAELKVLPVELQKREMAKFKEDMENMRKLTVNAFSNALIEKAASLRKGCENDAVAAATVESVKRLLEKFDDVYTGYIDDKKVLKLTEDVRLFVEGVDSSMINADDEFRGVIQNKMKQVVEDIQKVDGFELKRGIEL